jgi:hypothetical protein
MLDNISVIFDSDVITLFFKVVVLICIGLFVIFTLFLLNYSNSLKKIIVIKGLTGTTFIYLVALAYAIASISLFILALVIL